MPTADQEARTAFDLLERAWRSAREGDYAAAADDAAAASEAFKRVEIRLRAAEGITVMTGGA